METKYKCMRNLIILLSLINSFYNFSQCFNGNAENGDFTGWRGATSTRTSAGVSINQMVEGISPGFHSVTNAGFDPIVGGNLLSTVGEGLHSFKIGDNVNNNHGDRMSYTFTVTAANANFGFMYAMVLQDGAHNPLQINPYFSYIIHKGNNPNVFSTAGPNAVISSKQFIANVNNPFFKKNGSTVWKDWSYECINLSPYINQVVTISFYAVDCNEGGHYGYAYVDGLCAKLDPVPSFNIASRICYSDPVKMDATASLNEDSYFLSVQEADQSWNGTGPEYTQWFVAQKAGVIDLKAFLQSKGKTFECNKYYRIKLAVSNNCNSWVDLTKLIQITCPKINYLPDVIRCCIQNAHTVNIGPIANTPNYIVNWTAGGGVSFNPPPSNNDYTVTCNFNSNGYVDVNVSEFTIYSIRPPKFSVCTISDRIDFLVLDDFDLTIENKDEGCCETKLTAKVKFKDKCNKWENLSASQQQSLLNSIKFSWSTGETSASIIVSGPTSLYSVTVTSALNCSTKTVNYSYQQSPLYISNTSYPVVLSVNNALEAGVQGVNGKLLVIGSYYDSQGLYFPPIGTTQGIYKAQAMKLEIYNRWGELFRNNFS